MATCSTITFNINITASEREPIAGIIRANGIDLNQIENEHFYLIEMKLLNFLFQFFFFFMKRKEKPKKDIWQCKDGLNGQF